jgi:hypothetical protein
MLVLSDRDFRGGVMQTPARHAFIFAKGNAMKLPNSRGRSGTCVPDAAQDSRGIADAVCRIFEVSPAPLQTVLLHSLLRPLGALSVLGVADGIFGRIWYRHGWREFRMAPADLQDVHVEHVVALVEYVLQACPASVRALPGLLQAWVPDVPTVALAPLLAQLCAHLQRHAQAPPMGRAVSVPRFSMAPPANR